MSLAKESKILKGYLLCRLIELYPSNTKIGFSNSKVVQDAAERHFKIAPEQLSRYFSNKPQKNTLSETQIIWLTIRYGIHVELLIKYGQFNEAEALEKLNKIFG